VCNTHVEYDQRPDVFRWGLCSVPAWLFKNSIVFTFQQQLPFCHHQLLLLIGGRACAGAPCGTQASTHTWGGRPVAEMTWSRSRTPCCSC
jgi:hypothetical protein